MCVQHITPLGIKGETFFKPPGGFTLAGCGNKKPRTKRAGLVERIFGQMSALLVVGLIGLVNTVRVRRDFLC
jgi:hypothetical protein